MGSSVPSLLSSVPSCLGVSLYYILRYHHCLTTSQRGWGRCDCLRAVTQLRNGDEGASQTPSGLLVQGSLLPLHRGARDGEAAELWPGRPSRILLVPQKRCDVYWGTAWVWVSSLLDRMKVLESGRSWFESKTLLLTRWVILKTNLFFFCLHFLIWDGLLRELNDILR